jgi:membrane protease YdiL (CAAX protease family)
LESYQTDIGDVALASPRAVDRDRDARQIGIVVAMLAILGTLGFFNVATSWKTSGTIPLDQNLAAPLVAWGLRRRLRWSWFVALGLIWWNCLAFLFGLGALLLGYPIEVEVFSAKLNPLSPIVLLGGAACVGALVWMNSVLLRPSVRSLFRRPELRTPASRLWTTLAGTSAVLGLSQVLGVFAAAAIVGIPFAELRDSSRILTDGTLVSVASMMTAVLSTAMILFYVRLREDSRVSSYLGMQGLSSRDLLTWLGVAALLLTAQMVSSVLLAIPTPEFLLTAYRTAHPVLLLWVAVVVAAPISEEILFRGFLFTRLREQQLSVFASVGITAVTFAACHLGQYDAWGMANLVILGILLGLARASTGSTWAGIAVHSFTNLWAMLGTALLVR